MLKRLRRHGTTKVLVSLEDKILSELDTLAGEVDASRSEVLNDLLDYMLLTKEGEEIVNELYPEEEEGEEEEEEEESEEES